MATLTVPPTVYTPDDLLKLPDGKGYELVDGHLVEDGVSNEAVLIAGVIHGLLWEYRQRTKLGYAFADGMLLRCFPGDSGRVRKPDAGYISKARFSDDMRSQGFCTVAPELVVEVVSPNDVFYDVERKVDEYLAAGVQLVWVVSPETKTVVVYAHGGHVERLTGNQVLGGGTTLPGFECRVQAIFDEE